MNHFDRMGSIRNPVNNPQAALEAERRAEERAANRASLPCSIAVSEHTPGYGAFEKMITFYFPESWRGVEELFLYHTERRLYVRKTPGVEGYTMHKTRNNPWVKHNARVPLDWMAKRSAVLKPYTENPSFYYVDIYPEAE